MCNPSPEAGTERTLSEAARLQWLQLAESKLGHSFRSLELLEEALTHRSYSQPEERNYERLEFLGDSLLELVVSQELLERFPNADEGALTRMRASLVSRVHLSEVADRLDLGHLILLGRGEEKTGGRSKKTLLADVFESVAAAIYLDGGLAVGRDFVLQLLGADFDRLDTGQFPRRDHKSLLQETLHRLGKTPPVYRVLREDGPAHRRVFQVEVEIEGRSAGHAKGPSKKKAEQKAAAAALEGMRLEQDPG